MLKHVLPRQFYTCPLLEFSKGVHHSELFNVLLSNMMIAMTNSQQW